MSSTFEFT